MNWRSGVILGISAFIAAVAVFSLISYTWSAQLATPASVGAKSVTFRCGPLWESATVHGPPSTAYPVIGKPCSGRRQDQIMTGFDVAIGLLAIFLIATLGQEAPGRRLLRRSPIGPSPTSG